MPRIKQQATGNQWNALGLQLREMSATDFLNGPGKEFGLYDCVRKIPQIADGLKPSQRKAVYGTLKRLGEGGSTITVERLAAAVAEVTAYHHGTGSMEGAIVGLAQDFTGSNNLNLLKPEGQFGSRLDPVNGAARYIESGIHPNFRLLFKKEDEIILEQLEEDGTKIEPRYYLPILPMVLINGVDGVATGFASKIMNYNPEDLKRYILNILLDKPNRKPLVPWYRGFKGTVSREDTGQVVFKGVLDLENTTTVRITELPIGMYQDDIKDVLIRLQERGEIKDYNDYSTTEDINIEVTCPRVLTFDGPEPLYTKFKLISRATENFTVWLETGELKCFNTPEEIVDHFIIFRLEKYEERRLKLLELHGIDLDWLNEKLRFIKFYIENSVLFSKKRKDDLVALLVKEKFKEAHIDKLLDIRIYNLTLDQIEKLKEEIKEVEAKIKALKLTNNVEMYVKELEELKLP